MKDEILNTLHHFSYASYVAVENGILLTGSLLINKVFRDFPVYKTFDIKIRIPDDIKKDLPTVWEIGNQVDDSYSHRYSDGKLCLATDAEMKINFLQGLSLDEWIDIYIVPYFYSYEYL